MNIRKRHALRSLLSGAPVVIASWGLATHAAAGPAEVATPALAGSNTDASEQLESVIVTATRREQSVQNVPISINAIGQDELAQGSIKSIDDISALTPGLQFAVPNGFSSALPPFRFAV
jgi:iron complex outermembrane receptor protein